jgi:HlyD family secretion protein
MNAVRLGSIVLAVSLLVVVRLTAGDNPEPMKPLATHKVAFADLQVKVDGRGALENSGSQVVRCEVFNRHASKLKIKSVVANGTVVKKGDLLVELDDSYLQEHAVVQKITREKAEIDLETAEQNSKLVPKAAEAAIAGAQYSLESAEAELKKFNDSKGETLLKSNKNRLAIAEADVRYCQERVALEEKRLKDGKSTEGLVKARRKQEEAAAGVAEEAEAELDYMEKVLLPQYRKTLELAVESAKHSLESAKQSGETNERSAKLQLQLTRATRDFEVRDYKEALDDIEKCNIYAPRAGLVLYHMPTQTGANSNPSVLTKGASVQYGQKLLTVGEPSRFVVSVNIHESLVSQLKAGMPATVRVETFPDKALKAHVLGTAAVTPENAADDTKQYQVRVEIDDNVDKLRVRSGLSAQVTITGDARAEHVLAVPVAAVVVPKEKGKKPYCLVLTADGLEEREVETGLSDGKLVEIRAGLKEGDVVAVDRRVLLMP